MNTTANSFDEHEFRDWTLEEFESIQESHVFSDRYKKAKKKTIKAYRRRSASMTRLYKLAAALAACIAIPAGVYAAVTHTEFFNNAFGNTGRQNTAVHEEIIVEEGKSITVTYPKREYIAIDEAKAEALIGMQTNSDPISVDINDHTLTVLSTVRDENAIVMEFTLQCETGVTALMYDKLTNESKGAGMSDQATFYFHIADTSDYIYVDMDRSTDTLLHCYYYGLFVHGGSLKDGETPILNIQYWDKPLHNRSDQDIIHKKNIAIPAEHILDATAFTSETGGILRCSPISFMVDMAKGLGLTKGQAYDPAYLDAITINYTDGTDYQVFDRDMNIDNTSNLCGGTGENNTELMLIFNRLVDPAKISTITVNGIVYSRK